MTPYPGPIPDQPSPIISASARRRRYAIGSAIVVLLAAAAVTTAVALHHSHPPAPPDARAAGVAVVVGNTLYLPDGRRVTLPIPEGGRVGQPEIVPAGYLYTIDLPDQPGVTLRLAGNDGTGSYRDLGMLSNSRYRVTPDGRTAIIMAIDAHFNFTTVAIDLATGKRHIDKEFPADTIIDAVGDWALLRNGGSVGNVPVTALWNHRTGAVVKGADPTATDYGVFASGAVLRGEYVPAVGEPPTSALPSCYAVVPTTAFASTLQTGYCGPHIIGDAWLSPTGDWLLASITGGRPDGGDNMAMLRVADLTAGRWAPTMLDPSVAHSAATFWDSPTTVVTWADTDYVRCTTTGTCTDLHLPTTDLLAPTLGTPQ